jgi:CCR4-NOT transcriptional regulation complex NOT5 subunit
VQDIETAQLFLKALEGASLDDSGLDPETIDRLRNPITECVDISDNKDFRLSLNISDTYASEVTYEATRQGILRHSPDVEMLSHHRIKREIEELTGVVPITHDMCLNQQGPIETV